MSKKEKLSSEQKALVRRYLIWCYKTTKEDLDRIDRYFTQLKVDRYMLPLISKQQKQLNDEGQKKYIKKIEEFEEYIKAKEKRVFSQKYIDSQTKNLQPHYVYLINRLAAVEKAIIHFFSQGECNAIKKLYEEEMTNRILTARQHT